VRGVLPMASSDAVADAPGTPVRLAGVLGTAPAMQQVFRTVLSVAPCKTTVLITGESGTGKELIARALHEHGPRVSRPLVAINCAAIPETLLESELFGHERGAFTDAHQRKPGQFELAHGGTLFLDEVGELTPATQAKLLRVLEREEFLRVGGSQPISVDVRIVAATNRDLESLVHAGTFRADLYYRLNVVRIDLPPLRDRPEDVIPLLEHFFALKTRTLQVAPKRLTAAALAALERYHWPGNVRELENLVERLLVLVDGEVVGVEDLPEHVQRGEPPARSARELVLSGRRTLQQAVDEFEREIIEAALERTQWNQTRAAAVLGTTRRILRYRMHQLGIEGPDADGD